MVEGNTVRVVPEGNDTPPEHGSEEVRKASSARRPPQPGAVANDKVARAIAEGLMVLPHDNGIPPLLRRKERGLSSSPPAPERAVIEDPVPPPPAAIPLPVRQAVADNTVVTPHPSVFRSQATPLPLNRDAVQPVSNAAAQRAAPAQPAAELQPADKQSVAPALVKPEAPEPVRAAPPSLQDIRNTIPEPPMNADDPAPAAAPAPEAAPTPPAPDHAAAAHQPPPAQGQPYPHYPQHSYPPPPPQGYYPPPPAPPYGYPYAPQAYAPPPPAYYPPPAYAPPMPYPAPAYPYPQAFQQQPPPAPVAAQNPAPAVTESDAEGAAQLMSSLMQYLPPPGKFWSEADRDNWLDAAATLFDLAYGDIGHSDRRRHDHDRSNPNKPR